jgi:hypothetical protein
MYRIVPVVRDRGDATKAIGFLAKNRTRLTGKQHRDDLEQSCELVDYEGRGARLDPAKRNPELAAKQTSHGK